MRHQPLKEIATFFRQPCESDAHIAHYAIDSRLVEPGSLFFALEGEKVDGHDFLPQVAEKGGVAAIVSSTYRGDHFGLELIVVDDVLESLQSLAKKTMAQRKEKVVAITGSMGKTTTKEFLATLLKGKFRVAKSFANWNTQRTLPLNILNLKEEYDVLILEMGMSTHGQIAKLIDIAPPEIALLTRIAPAGLINFEGGLEAVARAKKEIFSAPTTKLGLVSSQAAQFSQVLFAYGLEKKIFGWKGEYLDPRMVDYCMEKGKKGVQINDSPTIALPFAATHLAENFLAAASIARELGVSWDHIMRRAKMLKSVERRFETIEFKGATVIQDSYNANPESMKAALGNLPKARGRTIGVLGAMPDLGTQSASFHQQVGQFAQDKLDHLFCIGDDAKELLSSFNNHGKQGHYFHEIESLKKALLDFIEPGDLVLLKGGNSLQLWTLLDK